MTGAPVEDQPASPGSPGSDDSERDGEILAAVDLGTNSFHLVVARCLAGERFEILEREKDMVRLGSGGGEMKRLSDEAMDRGVAALDRHRQIAEAQGADLRAVATSAVREATNQVTFLRRAREEAGVDVEVISGFEEARLIHLGVLQAVPIYDRRSLVIDIGGGSTEILVGEQGEALAARSLKLGAIRLTDRFLTAEPLKGKALKKARRHIRGELAPFAREVHRLGFEIAVGSSGTIETLARMVLLARGEEEPQTLNNARLTADELAGVIVRLTQAPTVRDRQRLEGLDPSRADIIVAGALVLEQAMETLGADELVVSDYALREGVLLDTYRRRHGGSLHHLHDIRRRSVVHLAELTDEDPEHSRHVADLALALFDGLSERHGLHDDGRELLEAAALLSNCGLFISHARHHKHSYYVIRNSEHLTGFTDDEIEVIAQVARYHRKSAPSTRKHPEFALLDAEGQRTVRTLAGILRIAIGLDRTHTRTVLGLSVDQEADDGVLVVVEHAAGTDVSVELWSAADRRHLLEEVLDDRVLIRSASAPPGPAGATAPGAGSGGAER